MEQEHRRVICMDHHSRVFIIKLAGRCNLNCSYCYMYNLGDTTYRERPRVMSKPVALAALSRIAQYAEEHGIDAVQLVLHGGEPLLVGKEWMKWFLDQVYRELGDGAAVGVGVQTNGTLLDAQWVRLFSRYCVGVGVSMDGLPQFHDQFRVDFAGRGSYAKVQHAVELLRDDREPPPWGVLVVANPDCSGVDVYHHLLRLGVRQMDFLWPDYHHDAPPPWPAGTLTAYFTALFDAWYEMDDPGVQIRFFSAIIRALMGRNTGIDALGPHPLTEVVVEADGSLEPLDVLRVCQNGMTRQGLDVLRHTVDDLRATELFDTCIHNQDLLPDPCRACPAHGVCGGGYMPHRWGVGRGFRNASVHCQDLLALITHVHDRVSCDLTTAARRAHVEPALSPI
jgi:uncharacterized protein